jgi:hypothetical protein
VLRLFLAKGGNVINVVQLGDVVKTADLPQYSLIMRCGVRRRSPARRSHP